MILGALSLVMQVGGLFFVSPESCGLDENRQKFRTGKSWNSWSCESGTGALLLKFLREKQSGRLTYFGE